MPLIYDLPRTPGRLAQQEERHLPLVTTLASTLVRTRNVASITASGLLAPALNLALVTAPQHADRSAPARISGILIAAPATFGAAARMTARIEGKGLCRRAYNIGFANADRCCCCCGASVAGARPSRVSPW